MIKDSNSKTDDTGWDIGIAAVLAPGTMHAIFHGHWLIALVGGLTGIFWFIAKDRGVSLKARIWITLVPQIVVLYYYGVWIRH